MGFRVTGLEPQAFEYLHALDDAALTKIGAVRVRVEQEHAAPCRISLEDAAPGECVILLNYQHQNADTPYRQQGPIFVRETHEKFDAANVIAPTLRRRTLSLRGFDTGNMMIEADLTEGAEAEALIARIFTNQNVVYIHAHYARRGCFAARIDRA